MPLLPLSRAPVAFHELVTHLPALPAPVSCCLLLGFIRTTTDPWSTANVPVVRTGVAACVARLRELLSAAEEAEEEEARSPLHSRS